MNYHRLRPTQTSICGSASLPYLFNLNLHKGSYTTLHCRLFKVLHMQNCKHQDKSRFISTVDKLSDWALSISMFVLYPIILIIILIDVTGRNFFATPLSWAIEGSGIFLIGAIFLAASRVELDRGHILLDILYANYSRKAKLVCDILTRFVAFLWMVGATIRT